MTKIDGIDLGSVAVNEAAKAKDAALEEQKVQIARRVRSLLEEIKQREGYLAHARQHRDVVTAQQDKYVADAEAVLALATQRLAEIQKGNWDALDANWGQPDKPIGENIIAHAAERVLPSCVDFGVEFPGLYHGGIIKARRR